MSEPRKPRAKKPAGSELRIEYMTLDELKRLPNNPKAHDSAAIGGSISRFGFKDPFAMDEKTGFLSEGHGRLDDLVMRRARNEPAPDGIRVDPDGKWRVPWDAWRVFAPYHYLTADLHRAARCFCLFVGDRPAAFAGMLHRPHALVDDIMGCSRLVTLPDWQGLGLAMALIDACGSAYRAAGKRLHTYPAHPALIRTFDRSKNWKLEKKPGTFQGAQGRTKNGVNHSTLAEGASKNRPCAVFSYDGPTMPKAQAARFLEPAATGGKR